MRSANPIPPARVADLIDEVRVLRWLLAEARWWAEGVREMLMEEAGYPDDAKVYRYPWTRDGEQAT